jgi:2-polyprenyl-3-methyl-5-hydroxy-6-metoxy-1,4-benzoquinol methylase
VGHKYDYAIDLTGDSAQARVVRMVGEGKRVLEIGAGPGSMTRVLRDSRGCHVTAIEVDRESIQTLTPFCEKVYAVDLNSEGWPQQLKDERPFDTVVVADVLEHLYDPWTALQRIKTFIGPEGCLIASVPHAGHHAIVASLLDENFEYREAGLLDKTHIRFFGIKNIQDLFEQAGLAIIEVQFVIRLPEDTELAGAWNRIPAATRIALQKNRFGLIYQVVLKAVHASTTTNSLKLSEIPYEPVAGTIPAAIPAADPTAKVLAFYLPQFHPTPENDQWWGKGFTEWTNVTRAEPLFDGHYQPHLPADLGFYDLRLRETRHEQIALAKQYGIHGFCYYYYWFSGTRVLHQPLDDMLKDPESDMPFCLCWANENWTRRWDGADREILIAQKHLPDDDIAFIRSVIPFFNDPRYIRLNGIPFLIVYQPQRMPNPPRAAQIWREYCEKAGIGPIHLCAAFTNDNDDYTQFGFDSGLQFPPHGCDAENINDAIDFYTPFHGRAVPYSDFARSYLQRIYSGRKVFRTVTPSWDQTPRVGSRAFLALNGTPANYEYWLAESLRKAATEFPDQERFVFVNAWNEWAEGCHLEPDRKFQRQFLEATLRAVSGVSEKTGFEGLALPKPEGPRTSVQARMDELQERSSRQQERLTALEKELEVERQRLREALQDLAGKRGNQGTP